MHDREYMSHAMRTSPRRGRLVVFMSLFAPLLLGFAPRVVAAETPIPQPLRDAGDAVIKALRADDLRAIEARFDPRMRILYPHDKLVATVRGLKQKAGSLQDCGEPTGGTRASHAVTDYRCNFSLAPVSVRLVWTTTGEISSLLFEPLPPEPKPMPLPANVHEEQVTTGAARWPLPGTWLLPASDKPVPAVVFVQDLGPNDRDETTGKNKPQRDFAVGLASQGIASLRYETRKRALPQRFKTELPSWTMADEVVDDAVAALAMLASRKEVGAVFVVGHGLGGMLAPRIAAVAADQGVHVAGVVMLAAPETSLADTIVQQQEFLAQMTIPAVTAQALDDIYARRENVRRLVEQQVVEKGPNEKSGNEKGVNEKSANEKSGNDRRGNDKSGKAPSPAPLLLDMPASAWLDIGRYDPAASLLDQPTLPALLIFGGRDFEVPIREKRLWEERVDTRPNTTLVEFPSVGHLMIDGRGSMSPAEYDKPGLVSQNVIDRVAGWIKARATSSRQPRSREGTSPTVRLPR